MAVAISPIMCFTSQEIYQHLWIYDKEKPTVFNHPWPQIDNLIDTQLISDQKLRSHMEGFLRLKQKLVEEFE